MVKTETLAGGEAPIMDTPTNPEGVTAMAGIGSVVHQDNRTGRNVVVTGYDVHGLPHTSFEPVDTAEVLIPYDQ